MTTWLVIDSNNTKVSGPHDEIPELEEGQRLVEVAIGCEWSDEKGGFVDVAHWMTKFNYLLLWTPTEMVRVKNSSDPEMVRAFMLLNAWEGPLNLLSADVQAGIARANTLGLLDDNTRAARISSGLPPV